jgi:hypothetical protein
MSILKSIIYFLTILIFLNYCATKPEVISRADEQEILKNQIQEYWQYNINGNIEKAYQLETPEFREKVSLIEYLNRFKLVKYLNVDILEIKIEGERGKATVNLTYMVLLKRLIQEKLRKVKEEDWIKIESIWYHIPEE